MYNWVMSSLVFHDKEPKPAPGYLRLLQEFINTCDIDYEIEGLDTPDALTSWLQQAGLLEKSVRADLKDFRVAISLREALRRLLWINNGGEIDPCTVRDLNQMAGKLSLHVRFTERGQAWYVEPASTVEGAFGNILGLVVYAQAADVWKRLKTCANSECKWIFYDASKNRVGSWCRMSTCGNRAKSKAHRERQKKASGA